MKAIWLNKVALQNSGNEGLSNTKFGKSSYPYIEICMKKVSREDQSIPRKNTYQRFPWIRLKIVIGATRTTPTLESHQVLTLDSNTFWKRCYKVWPSHSADLITKESYFFLGKTFNAVKFALSRTRTWHKGFSGTLRIKFYEVCARKKVIYAKILRGSWNPPPKAFRLIS